MMRFTKLASCVCLALTIFVASHPAFATTIEQRISARLDALERENAALRARVRRLEASRAARTKHHPARVAMPLPRKALAADRDRVIAPRHVSSPRFEISGSLMYLQPGAGNLEYGTLVTPLPVVSPSWDNQALKPNYDPAFSIGARYIANESFDVALNWTHQRSTTNASVSAEPTQMVGPPFLIGPESALYKEGRGEVKFAYDAVNLDAGYTFCADCAFRLRAFGGLQYARLGEDLTGTFQSHNGAASMSSTTHTLFTGVGPRLGVNGQYAIGDVRLIGEVAAAALVGKEESRINFTTNAPALSGPNNQSLTSPDATRVVPSIDARVAAAYVFPRGDYGQFKIEVGYRAAIYFNAVSQYELTQVPTSLMLPPNGIYLATADKTYSNFTDQGPYVTASWLFGPGE